MKQGTLHSSHSFTQGNLLTRGTRHKMIDAVAQSPQSLDLSPQILDSEGKCTVMRSESACTSKGFVHSMGS